jgi:hemerythrin-like domain-containing protein
MLQLECRRPRGTRAGNTQNHHCGERHEIFIDEKSGVVEGGSMDLDRVDEILDDVREDHELVREQLRMLAGLEGMIAGAEGMQLEKALQLLRGASHFFQTRLLPHLAHEEQGMFVLLREHLPRGSTLIYELETEHEQMRKLCERLRVELAWLRHEKHRRQQRLLTDLQALCVQITGLLSQHAEREERLIQSHLKSAMARASPK